MSIKDIIVANTTLLLSSEQVNKVFNFCPMIRLYILDQCTILSGTQKLNSLRLCALMLFILVYYC